MKTFKAYIPISFLLFQRYKLYSGTTSISGIRVNVYKILKALFTTMVLYLGWNDDIPDGGIKTKSKTNNSDCELNDTLYSSTNDAQRSMAPLLFCFT